MIKEQFCGWRLGEIAWLGFSVSSVVGLSLFWGETWLGIVAAATGMLYTVLAGKGKASCFLFGLVNAPVYAWLSYRHGYYGDFALNVYYFVMMFPGLWAWWRHPAQTAEEGIVRTRLTARGRLSLMVVCLAGVLVLWFVLRLLGGNRPFCDAVTNVLSIAAMWLTVRRALEEWILWIVVDAVEVFMWVRVWLAGDGMLSVLLMWLLFLANGVYMLRLWLRVEHRKTLIDSKWANPSLTRVARRKEF